MKKKYSKPVTLKRAFFDHALDAISTIDPKLSITHRMLLDAERVTLMRLCLAASKSEEAKRGGFEAALLGAIADDALACTRFTRLRELEELLNVEGLEFNYRGHVLRYEPATYKPAFAFWSAEPEGADGETHCPYAVSILELANQIDELFE